MGIVKKFLKSKKKEKNKIRRKYKKRTWLAKPLTTEEIEFLDRYLQPKKGLNYKYLFKILKEEKAYQGNTYHKRTEEIFARFIFQELTQ